MLYSNYYIASHLFHGSFSFIMGTQLDVLLVGREKDRLEHIWQNIIKELQRLDKLMNRFDAESEVSRINECAQTSPVPVSGEMWNILRECYHYFHLTKGYFDITLSDFRRVEWDMEEQRIFFTTPGLQLDLGGYGKGYALKQIERMVKQQGIEKALINFGNSSVLGVGTHPHGEYWPIGIENPYTKELLVTVPLCNNSLSISGNTPVHPEHIRNPFNGEYIKERKLVSVISVNPVEAEVLTTAFMIMPEDEMAGLTPYFDINEKHIYIL